MNLPGIEPRRDRRRWYQRDRSGRREIGWYAGGGGQSLFESAPAWRSAAGGASSAQRAACPDVAFDADPENGVKVIIAGKEEEVIIGTSAGAPIWQRIWARVEALTRSCGFAGPVIYGSEPAGAFRRHHDRRQRPLPVHARLGLLP